MEKKKTELKKPLQAKNNKAKKTQKGRRKGDGDQPGKPATGIYILIKK